MELTAFRELSTDTIDCSGQAGVQEAPNWSKQQARTKADLRSKRDIRR